MNIYICFIFWSLEFRSELEEYAEMQEQERRRKAEKAHKEKREILARKNHYLISTEVIPGVFNSPFLPWVVIGLSVTLDKSQLHSTSIKV